MSTTSMFFDIFGRDKGVGDLFDKVAGHGKNVTGVLQGLGGAAAAMGIVKAGKDSVDAFKDTAGSALLLQREMGSSAEDASRLGFALTQAGMSAEDTKKGFGIFSKNLVASEKDAASHAKMVGELGFEYMDAHGKLLPMTEILPALATKFQGMENGPEKTALAMQIFGKSGADMVPFLNKGGDAIGELMHKSDELGTTLSQDQVNSFKEAKAESREWEATLRGLETTIGGALLPVLTGFQGFIHSTLAPAIQDAVGWFKGLSPEMQHVITVIGGILLVGGPLVLMIGKFAQAFSAVMEVVKVFKGVMLGLNAVLAANPFVLIILGIAALVAGLIWAYENVGWFKDFVDAAFKLIGEVVSNVINWITGTLVPSLVAGWNWAMNASVALGTFLTDVWNGIVSGVSGAVNGVIDFFMGMPGRILAALGNLGGLLLNIGGQVIGGLIKGIEGALSGLGDVLGNVGKFIADHKGPEEYDRGLLVPHGGWILGGLSTGILAGLPSLQSTLGIVSDTISDHMNTQANVALNVSGSGPASAAAVFGGSSDGKVDELIAAIKAQRPINVHPSPSLSPADQARMIAEQINWSAK